MTAMWGLKILPEEQMGCNKALFIRCKRKGVI